MNSINELFLSSLKAALLGESVEWNEQLKIEEWLELFRLAQEHSVLPMIYEAVYNCPAARMTDPGIFAQFKQMTVRDVMVQTMKTMEFLSLLMYMQGAGVRPMVVKGIICRSLYPNPDYRMSGDEDVLISPEQFDTCHKALMDYGMVLSDPSQNIHEVYEVPYGKKGSPLYIELHKNLFPPDSNAYGEFNELFSNVRENAITLEIEGVSIPTMSHTDHLFYLICHSFKHFLHSGFGLRQVCDICMYANKFGAEIDWNYVLASCKKINAEQFSAALFMIGEKYLTFDADKACYPKCWRDIKVDETAMLADLMDSGVYGGGTMSRKHSSNITLEAVAAEKQGKKAKSGFIASAFPSAEKLSGRYPYLKEKPFLLPIAWADRILKYRKETASGNSENNAAEALKIGKERIELMKQYGIIK